MLNSFELSGLWWLPENPENKIHGKLRYNSQKRTTLFLDGTFNKNPEEGDFYEIALGDSYGKKITLKNCLRSNLEIKRYPDSREYMTSEFVVSVFYVGWHFAKKEDIKFTRLFVRYSQLEEWLGERPFHFEVSKNEEGLEEHMIKFTMPNVKEIILDGFKISIGYGFSERMDVWKKPEFEAHAWISVDVSDEMHIDEFFPIVYHIKNFLGFATGNTVSILDITGQNKNMDSHETIQISYHEEVSEEKLFEPPFLPFQYNSISERPEFYLQNWFDMIKNLEPTYDLFFGTMYNSHLYPTHAFLSLAQALESYHSRTFDNDVMPDEAFNPILSQILEIIGKIPQGYQQHFKTKASYMNRKSLRRRIKELFEKYGELFRPFIDDENEFIGKVVDTRNYFTHYSPESEKGAAKVIDIPFLSQNLRFILIVIFLKEIGFDDAFARQVLTRYMRFRIRRIFA